MGRNKGKWDGQNWPARKQPMIPVRLKRAPPGTSFVFALDDSGPTQPLLNEHRQFAEAEFPFTSLTAVGINTRYLSDFEQRWTDLRVEIQRALEVETLPPLHARLMFGENRPETHRRAPNPYLKASRQQVQEWYLGALRIVGEYLKRPYGGASFNTVIDRYDTSETWEQIFLLEEAMKEGEFLKLYRRRQHKNLHKNYIAAVSSALTLATLDTFQVLNEQMAIIHADCSLLLDPYTEAAGFDDGAAFGFLSRHLKLRRITGAREVADTDNEALCQAADLIAYMWFRRELHQHRLKDDPHRQLEDFVQQGKSLIDGFDMNQHIAVSRVNRGRTIEAISIYSAARYAVAHHILRQAKKDEIPVKARNRAETVDRVMLTPDEFLARCKIVLATNRKDLIYLPVLKDGVLERWEASGRSDDFDLNGEDHP